MNSGTGWTLLFAAAASNTYYGSNWDYWYIAGETTNLITTQGTGKSEAYDEMPVQEIRLTASYGSSEIIASTLVQYDNMLEVVGEKITTCADLNYTGRHVFSASTRTGSYFPNDYIAVVSCDGDGDDLEFDTHFDASVFSANYNHSDYNKNSGDIGSEYRVGGNEDDSTSGSSNSLQVWAR